MGGKLHQLPRLNAAAYHALEARVRAVTERHFPGTEVPRALGDKRDFGDLDLLVPSEDWSEAKVAAWASELGARDVRRNGPTWTSLVDLTEAELALGPAPHERATAQALQVDLFPGPAEWVRGCAQFMHYGEVGNLVSRLARPWGLKVGQDGVEYVLRDPRAPSFKRTLLLTRDFAALLELVELDPEPWRQGLQSEDHLYQWLTASPQFRPESYQRPPSTVGKKLKHRPAAARFAARVRAEYGELPELDEGEREARRAAFWTPEARQAREARLMAWAPGQAADLEGWVQAQLTALETSLRRGARAGGDVVMRLRPDLKGPRLGQVMGALRTHTVNGLPFAEWSDQASDAELEAELRKVAAQVHPEAGQPEAGHPEAGEVQEQA